MQHSIKKYIRYAHLAKVLLRRKLLPQYRNTPQASVEHKWNVIDQLRIKSGATVFVETGTYHGDTIERFKNAFRTIYTIEVDHELAQKARKRFAGTRHIDVLEGDSAIVLQAILERLHAPAVFWLDAHCSGENTAQGAEYTPVLSEVRLILSRNIPHLIAIDDARLFDGVNYPTLGQVRRLVTKIAPNVRFVAADDIITIQP